MDSLIAFKNNTNKRYFMVSEVWPTEQYVEHKSRLFKLLAEKQNSYSWKELTEPRKAGVNVINCSFGSVVVTDALLNLLRSHPE